MCRKSLYCMSSILAVSMLLACLVPASAVQAKEVVLTDAQVENLVRRSYPYVAMYNVINKFAQKVGGWNTCAADIRLKDHTMREIARPNNDTLYIGCQLDLRKAPMILEMPAFDSKYVSLMVSGYDHYVSIPMSTRLGDFKQPARILFYTARTDGYKGEPVAGVDDTFEATGDFINATLRIMPHASEPARFKRIVEQMASMKIMTLSEYQGGQAKPLNDIQFPPFGQTDADVFENNLLEVMQFVFNHTTFDPTNPMDQAVLATYTSLGVAPGKTYNPDQVAKIDGKRVRETAQRIQRKWLGNLTDPLKFDDLRPRIFQPKGQTDLEAMLAVSIIGPIGIPQEEAVYPPVATADGKQMNAMHDYVIRMTRNELPPARAFWSLTLYDLKNGFFIPNDRKKYSVGENAGMKLNEDGGIAIYIAAEQLEGVPEENWLPIPRADLDLSPQMRIYAPDLEKMGTWKPPKAESIKAEAGKQTSHSGGDVDILQSWQGDYPVAQLQILPETQRQHAVGFIDDAETFKNVWKAFKPGEDVPQIDFKTSMVIFARNTQFYNRISIGNVNLKSGVAEIIAIETMSAMPIEDKVAMSLVEVPRQGISGIQAGDNTIPVKAKRSSRR